MRKRGSRFGRPLERWETKVTDVVGDELRAKREKTLSLMKTRYEMLKNAVGDAGAGGSLPPRAHLPRD